MSHAAYDRPPVEVRPVRFQGAEPPDPRDRRRHPRTRTREEAVAHRVDFGLATAVVIYDISAGGLGIISPDRHAVDELLMVEWRHGFLVGRVRHVKETSVGFFIGVQLEELKAHRLLIAEICQAALTGLYAGAGSPSDKNEDREPHHQYNLPAEPASLP